MLASGSYDRTIRLWTIREGFHDIGGAPLRGHAHWVRFVMPLVTSLISLTKHVCFTSVLCTRARPQALVGSCTTLGVTSPTCMQVMALAFTRDCALLASASYDRSVRVWDVAARRALQVGDSTHARTHSEKEIVQRTEIITHTSLVAKRADASMALQVFNGHTDRVTCVCFLSLAGNRGEGGSGASDQRENGEGLVLASGSYDKQIKLWDVDTGKALENELRFAATGFFLCAFFAIACLVVCINDGITSCTCACGFSHVCGVKAREIAPCKLHAMHTGATRVKSNLSLQ